MNRSSYALGTLLVAVAMTAISLEPFSWAQEGQGTGKKAPPDAWKQLEYFVGSWEGTGDGNSGTSTVERHYEFILGGKYLHGRTTSVFPPQEKNPKGETHEDWEFFSFDKSRKIPVIRQFNVEGFVNRYALEEISADGKTMVFTTEHVENGPPGLRARTTYKIVSDDKFTEVFELAFPGADFKPCVTSQLERKR